MAWWNRVNDKIRPWWLGLEMQEKSFMILVKTKRESVYVMCEELSDIQQWDIAYYMGVELKQAWSNGYMAFIWKEENADLGGIVGIKNELSLVIQNDRMRWFRPVDNKERWLIRPNVVQHWR